MKNSMMMMMIMIIIVIIIIIIIISEYSVSFNINHVYEKIFSKNSRAQDFFTL